MYLWAAEEPPGAKLDEGDVVADILDVAKPEKKPLKIGIADGAAQRPPRSGNPRVLPKRT
jgi:hypothetical protein